MKWLLIISIICVSNVFAQENWTIHRCMDSALTNSQKARIADLNLAEATYVQSSHKYSYLPDLNAGIAHGYNFGQTIDPFTNQFAANRVQYDNFYFSSSVLLFSSLQNYYQAKLLQTAIDIHNVKSQMTDQSIQLEVVTAYLQCKLNNEIVQMSRSHSQTTQILLENAQLLYAEELTTKSNLLEIEAQNAQDYYLLKQAENDLSYSLLILQQLIGIEHDSSFQISTDSTDFELLKDGAVELSSDEQLTNYLLEEQLLLSKQTKSQLLPKLSLNGSIGSGYSGNNTFQDNNGNFVPKPFGVQVDENFYQSAFATISVPIFNGNKVRTQVKINSLEYERRLLEHEIRITSRENQIATLKLEISNSKELLKAMNSSRRAMLANYENSILLFESGNVSSYDLIQTKDKLLKVESEFIQNKYKLLFSQIILELL